MKKKRAKKRASRRNPSSHPILVGIATVLLEGIAGWIVGSTIKLEPGVSAYGLKTAGTMALVNGGGYALGAHLFPKSKTAILVGSIISAIFAGSGAAYATHLAKLPARGHDA